LSADSCFQQSEEGNNFVFPEDQLSATKSEPITM